METSISNYQLVWRYRNKQKFDHFRCDLESALDHFGILFCQKNWISETDLRLLQTSKMERFLIIVNGWKLLTIMTHSSILDVAAALEPPLIISTNLLFQLTIRNFTHVPVVTSTKERWTQILAVKLTKQSNKKYQTCQFCKALKRSKKSKKGFLVHNLSCNKKCQKKAVSS